jgi:uncharacterized protein (UPF0371 family)
MKSNLGFDTDKYLKAQQQAIKKRLNKFSGRLYLEFGGKLLQDFHATRTLPGYDSNAKLTLLKSLKKNLGILYCVSSKQLSNGKIRGDLGIGYDLTTLKDLETLQKNDLPILGVVINRYEGETEANIFERRLKNMNIPVYKRKEIHEYPNNLNLILSNNGYGADNYIKTDKSLIVVWGAGPGSGKLSTCLGQIYLDEKHGINSGYAKFETFPVWDLPLDHPVNIAYEAATADLGDFNLIDPFHLKAHKKKAINYNRDVDSFPIIKTTFKKVLSKNNFSRNYCSPTDMGFNVLKKGIVNNSIVCKAAKREINFYLFRYRQEFKKGIVNKKVISRIESLIKKVGINEKYLPTVSQARISKKRAENQKNKGEKGIYCGSAIELENGLIVTGKNSQLLHAEASMVLNAIKILAKIPDDFELISSSVIKQINKLKNQIGEISHSLDCSETLLALATSTHFNPSALKAQSFLSKLRGCYMHTTHKLSSADEIIFRKLGIWVSTDGLVGKM